MQPRPRVVLASGSPRRRHLLELIGIPCLVVPANLDEHQLPDEEAAEFAQRAARDKAQAVAAATQVPGSGLRVPSSERESETDPSFQSPSTESRSPSSRADSRSGFDGDRDIAPQQTLVAVLGADTVVEVGGVALGKPGDAGEAAEMLRLLSGRSHRVHTGVALVVGGHCESLVDTATVRFRSLTDAMIRWYVASGEPMDKAGAYAVQERGGILVDGIDGSPNTVIGLPLHRLPELFSACGLDFWSLLDAS